MSLEITTNWLTVFRIVCIPVGVWTLFHSPSAPWQCTAWLIYFVLGLTDIADGHWARRSNRTTSLGAFLDPVADKALIGSAMISLSILDRFPWWITIVILAREIGITIFRLLVIRDGVIPASKGGKLKTAFQSFGVGFFILPLPHCLFPARNIFMGIAIALTIGTGIDYIVKWSKSR
jgi:CDP-diacylglycerol--glycerol-3-phosphate 3-phosphatidyltransferase